MDVGQKFILAPLAVAEQTVSILVLMDVGQKYWCDLNDESSMLGFNPCFNGCRSEIIHAMVYL